MSSEKKSWQDTTAGISKIEGLNFDGDRFWEECTITLNGKGEQWPGITAQSFTIKLNDKEIFRKVLFGKKEIKVKIDSDKGFNITGDMAHQFAARFVKADGSVTVACTYKESSLLKSKSVTWKDSGGITIMENLFLDATENWKSCQIKVEGVQNGTNNFSMQLINDGSLVEQPIKDTLFGTESRHYPFLLNGKGTLLVSGYFIAGGAKVTLTGFY